jgi:hypothetical protein
MMPHSLTPSPVVNKALEDIMSQAELREAVITLRTLVEGPEAEEE